MQSTTFSRRSALGMGALAVLGVTGLQKGPAASAAPATSGTVRPTGPGYVRYEDLYKSGDTVTGAMSRLTKPAIITFPEGRFECSDFGNGYTSGISIPKIAKGIWGSGRGSLGNNSGTIFTMKANSSSKKALIPAQGSSGTTPTTLMMQSGSASSVSYGQFQIAGTEQGHVFHGLAIYSPTGSASVTDVLVSGWSGDNGAPPGETFGLTIHGGSNNTLTRVEADGRREAGGTSFGAVGLTFQNTVGGSMTDCTSHHGVASPVVLFQSFNVKTYNLKVGSLDDKSSVTRGSSFNHERTSGCEHYNPSIITRETNRGVHITHSNDTYKLTVDGVSYSTVNGTIKVVDPVFNDIWGDGAFYIETWVPYWNGNTMTLDNKPKVQHADGSTRPYKWAFAGKHYKIS